MRLETALRLTRSLTFVTRKHTSLRHYLRQNASKSKTNTGKSTSSFIADPSLVRLLALLEVRSAQRAEVPGTRSCDNDVSVKHTPRTTISTYPSLRLCRSCAPQSFHLLRSPFWSCRRRRQRERRRGSGSGLPIRSRAQISNPLGYDRTTRIVRVLRLR